MNELLSGRSAVITGASQGLGKSIARAFIDAGAKVLITGRDGERLREAETELGKGTNFLFARQGDVSDPAEAAALARHAFDLFGRVDILVNNAGIYGPMGPLHETDPAEWMHAVRVNLFGSMLASRAFVPHFRDNRYGKIIQLSGGGATAPMPRFSAYAASKAAVVRFAESLALEVREFGIDVNSVAPGALNTRLLHEVLEAGPARVGETVYNKALEQKESGGASRQRAAALAVFLASSASDGITGRLISAVWDPWEDLPAHRDELDSTDIYTIRRIVPEDRGAIWTKQ